MDEVKVSNLALANLGQNQIMALSDESQPARFCNTYYEQTRDEVLQMAFWSFAIVRADLSRLVDAPLNQWLYQFQLPSDYIRIIEMNRCLVFGSSNVFVIEGTKLLCNSETAAIRYVSQVTDANLFHPLFVETLSFALAAKLAKPLTGDQNVAQIMRAAAADTLAKAQRTDALEQRPTLEPQFIRSPLVNARQCGWRGGPFLGFYTP